MITMMMMMVTMSPSPMMMMVTMPPSDDDDDDDDNLALLCGLCNTFNQGAALVVARSVSGDHWLRQNHNIIIINDPDLDNHGHGHCDLHQRPCKIMTSSWS